MMELMIQVVEQVTEKQPDESTFINVHHNYCSCEKCNYVDPQTNKIISEQLWVTRKGATSAKKGEYGTFGKYFKNGLELLRYQNTFCEQKRFETFSQMLRAASLVCKSQESRKIK